jgi:hypothetical protein
MGGFIGRCSIFSEQRLSTTAGSLELASVFSALEAVNNRRRGKGHARIL